MEAKRKTKVQPYSVSTDDLNFEVYNFFAFFEYCTPVLDSAINPSVIFLSMVGFVYLLVGHVSSFLTGLSLP